MNASKKPAPGWHLGTGYDTALDSRDHNPIHHRLQALLLSLTLYGAEIIALPCALVLGMLP